MKNILFLFGLNFFIFSIGCSSVTEKPTLRKLSSDKNLESCSDYIVDIENRAFAQAYAELSDYEGEDRGKLFSEIYSAKIQQLTSTEKYKSCLEKNQESLKNHPWLLKKD